ncbi:Hypothetical_protein [Hexamita inflata]|uniref:Hypothetical_protein n=1 Tax=Hexamita inflata TaxID=28002 RepID=A0ABP1H2C1_9EUKA
MQIKYINYVCQLQQCILYILYIIIVFQSKQFIRLPVFILIQTTRQISIFQKLKQIQNGFVKLRPVLSEFFFAPNLALNSREQIILREKIKLKVNKLNANVNLELKIMHLRIKQLKLVYKISVVKRDFVVMAGVGKIGEQMVGNGVKMEGLYIERMEGIQYLRKQSFGLFKEKVLCGVRKCVSGINNIG